jgi:hypothetical protein
MLFSDYEKDAQLAFFSFNQSLRHFIACSPMRQLILKVQELDECNQSRSPAPVKDQDVITLSADSFVIFVKGILVGLISAHELHLIALVGSPLAASKHPSVVVDVPLGLIFPKDSLFLASFSRCVSNYFFSRLVSDNRCRNHRPSI